MMEVPSAGVSINSLKDMNSSHTPFLFSTPEDIVESPMSINPVNQEMSSEVGGQFDDANEDEHEKSDQRTAGRFHNVLEYNISPQPNRRQSHRQTEHRSDIDREMVRIRYPSFPFHWTPLPRSHFAARF